jgi:hypothetical protein
MNRRRPQSLGGTQVLPRLVKYTLLPINQSRLARQSGSISQDGNGVLTILTVPTSVPYYSYHITPHHTALTYQERSWES